MNGEKSARHSTRKQTRRGEAFCFTLDHAAIAALRRMQEGPRAAGRLISQLLLSEEARREERARMTVKAAQRQG
jgi:hypothetical protein